MVKPSRQPIMNPPEDSPKAITERVKKLRESPQTDKVREEIRRLIKEYFRRYPSKAGN